MKKLFVLCLLMFSSTLFATSLMPPVNVGISAKDIKGWKHPFEVEISFDLNWETVNLDLSNKDVKAKIFLPPALKLLQGELCWTGKLDDGKVQIIKLLVRPTLEKNLFYDLGVVVESDMLTNRLIIRESIYLAEDKGLVINPSLAILAEKHAWFKNEIGFERREMLNRKGERVQIMAIDASNTPQVDIKKVEDPQEYYPNKLLNKE